MKNYCLILLFALSSCVASDQQSQTRAVINLAESTQIIRTLIYENKLGELLDNNDPAQLALLIDNVSPAQMALEVEVLSTTVPLVVVYYYKDSPEARNFMEQLEPLAQEYDNRVKFVAVDTDKLFTLALIADVEQLPLVVLVKNRTIVERIKDVSFDAIKTTIDTLSSQS